MSVWTSDLRNLRKRIEATLVDPNKIQIKHICTLIFWPIHTFFIVKVDIGDIAIARLTSFSDFLHRGVKTFVKLYLHLDQYLYQRA